MYIGKQYYAREQNYETLDIQQQRQIHSAALRVRWEHGMSLHQPEALALLQQAAGEKIAIAGNIPPVEVMLQGSTDQVLQAGKRCIEQASGNPMGFTLAAGCQLPPGVSRENLLAMLLAARKYGRHARKGRPCAILA